MARPVHESGRVGLGPKLSSTRLDQVAKFQTCIRLNIWVGFDISSNRLIGLKLSICRV